MLTGNKNFRCPYDGFRLVGIEDLQPGKQFIKINKETYDPSVHPCLQGVRIRLDDEPVSVKHVYYHQVLPHSDEGFFTTREEFLSSDGKFIYLVYEPKRVKEYKNHRVFISGSLRQARAVKSW